MGQGAVIEIDMTMPFQNSILLLDKPLGLSSNAALQKVRHLFGKPVFRKPVSGKHRPKQPALEKPKAGHAGTLDPLATGMLPICLGEATKFAGYLLTESKCYQTRVDSVSRPSVAIVMVSRWQPPMCRI